MTRKSWDGPHFPTCDRCGWPIVREWLAWYCAECKQTVCRGEDAGGPCPCACPIQMPRPDPFPEDP